MTQATSETGQRINSPLSNPQYNLMQALVSKLEAIEAYEQYRNDGGDAELWGRLLDDERRHAEELKSALQRQMKG
jgi:hypothetical protein